MRAERLEDLRRHRSALFSAAGVSQRPEADRRADPSGLWNGAIYASPRLRSIFSISATSSSSLRII